ncbi:hypothetical protein FHS28_001166 [Roseateles terrae]|uniref:Uncharacterized protein n=1 Tax=Roseateles terrae TaxID=431060 RepID=A0ABR6GQ25_9BURK|nr:hypothetical protein [Roseateles terrae]
MDDPAPGESDREQSEGDGREAYEASLAMRCMGAGVVTPMKTLPLCAARVHLQFEPGREGMTIIPASRPD